MREAVVVASSRTGLAKSFRGSFNMTRPEDLAARCIQDLRRKVPQVNADEVEDVVLGCAMPHGTQGMNIARRVAVLAGLPAAGMTVNRFCASGIQAIAIAAHEIIHESVDIAVGGGVESISLTPRDLDPHPHLASMKPGLYLEMGVTAEIVAQRYGVSREAQDEYALISQQRTGRAQADDYFKGEIVPVDTTMLMPDKTTKTVTCLRDECNRPNTTMEGLAALKPEFDPDSGKGSVTAGNSSQLSDGASATLLMSRERAEHLAVPYQLIFRGLAIAACEPDEMGIGPVFAVPKLLARHGLRAGDIDLWELNEAFAAQVIYCRDRLGIPMEKLNLNGGSISIGHPFGMTGSRMVGTLANQLARMPNARYGVVTMCVGGGQGAAALFESAMR